MQRFFFVFYLVFLSISFAHSAVTITFSESGGDVVATSSGSLIMDGLTLYGQYQGTGGYIGGAGYNPAWSCFVLVGTDPEQAHSYRFLNWTNDNVDVCVTGGMSYASSGSGNFVGVFSWTGNPDGIYVPNNYVSGSPIAGTSTWSNATFASLGLVPGSYVFTFGDGATADSINLNIDPGDAPFADSFEAPPADASF